jgi:hypothetical protein
VVDRGRRKKWRRRGLRTVAPRRIGLLNGGGYARGGARDGRCSEKESFGATCSGIEASQTIGAGATENATLAVASAGICSVWQTWHGVAGPLVCSCSSAPPHAKYSNAKQANSARPRRSPSLSRVTYGGIPEDTVGASTPFRSSLDGNRSFLVASVVGMHPNQQSVASHWVVDRGGLNPGETALERTTWTAGVVSASSSFPALDPCRCYGLFLPIQPPMPRRARHLRLLALLLGIVFLGAQLHFCADLTSAPSGTHICPVCSAIGAAVLAPSPGIVLVALIKPLEARTHAFVSSPEIPRDTSPRAPPAFS